MGELPPEQQKSLKKAFVWMIACLLLGLTGPGIVGLIAIIIDIVNR